MMRYSINDLQKITGIKAHTIRVWEKRYNAVSPQRTNTNIRYYDENNLKKLLNISTLNKHGFKISEIIKMDNSGICDKILEVSSASNNYESHLNNMVIAMLDLDEQKFEKALTSAIIKLGFGKTITQIVYPFLEKVGILWQTGTIIPAQEHFISNLIRQKLILAIDGHQNSAGADCKTFLLFLPENELHELGLLFYSYLIKKAGHKVIYLGQWVPLSDVLSVVKMRNPDYIVTYFISALDQNEIPEYLAKLSKGFSHKKIFIAGPQIKQLDTTLPSNIISLFDAEVFAAQLSTI